MRTTNKAFKVQVQEHILNILSEDYFETTPERLQHVVDSFNDWYSPYEQKIQPNRYKAYADWFMGLPSVISVEFRHFAISDILKEWFTNCGMPYIEKDGDIETTYYLHLVTREFYALCQKNKIDIH
jgi:hypothetical protein